MNDGTTENNTNEQIVSDSVISDSDFITALHKRIKNNQPTEASVADKVSGNDKIVNDDNEENPNEPNENPIQEDSKQNSQGNPEETTETSVDEGTSEKESITTHDYSKLSDPYKRKGQEIIIDDVNEIRELVSKGLDYTRKTQELANERKKIKAFQNQGIEEADINMLIDVHNGNTQAIKAFAKKFNVKIDSWEQENSNEENNDTYTPNNYIMGDTENIIDTNFEMIQDTYSESDYNTVVEVLGNLDSKSSTYVRENPNAMLAIAEDISNGTYAEVMKVIDKQKLLGKYNRNFIETYVPLAVKIMKKKEASVQEEKKQIKDKKVTTITPPKSLAITKSREIPSNKVTKDALSESLTGNEYLLQMKNKYKIK